MIYYSFCQWYIQMKFFYLIYSKLLFGWIVPDQFFYEFFFGMEHAMMAQRKGDENKKRKKSTRKYTYT